MRCIGPIEVKWAYILFFLFFRCSGPTGQQWYLLFLYFFYFVHKLFLDAMQWTDWAAVGLTSLVLAFAIADDVQQGTLSLSLSLSLSHTHTHAHFLSLSLPLYIYIWWLYMYIMTRWYYMEGLRSLALARALDICRWCLALHSLSLSLSFSLSLSIWWLYVNNGSLILYGRALFLYTIYVRVYFTLADLGHWPMGNTVLHTTMQWRL